MNMSRRPGNPFTMAEKRRILRYIIDWQAQYKVKGNALWMQMEPAFNGKHTWQSLKEHFKKKLYPNLASSDLQLTQEQIRTFRRAYSGTLSSTAGQKNKQASPTSTFHDLCSDDEDVPAGVSENPVAESVPSTSKNEEGEDISGEKQEGIVDEPNTTKVSSRGTTDLTHGTWVVYPRPIVTYTDSSSSEEDGCAAAADSQTLCPDKPLDLDETVVDSDEWEGDSSLVL